MDYRINNEAIVACVIVQVSRHGKFEIPFVAGIVNLIMQKKLRKRILSSSEVQTDELLAMFGHLDGTLFGVIVNSMTMLLEGGCLIRHGDKLMLTSLGIQLCNEMSDGRSDTLTEILRDVDRVISHYKAIDLRSLYQQFWIDL